MSQDSSSKVLWASVTDAGGGREDARLRSRLDFGFGVYDDAIDDAEWERGNLGRVLGGDCLIGLDGGYFLASVRRHDKCRQSVYAERERDVGFLAARFGWAVVGITAQCVIDRGQLYPNQHLNDRAADVHPT